MLNTPSHPRTGKPLKPIFVSEKTGRTYWPIMGGSEPAVEAPAAPAETVTIPVPTPPPAPARVFTDADIAKARQEEKDKLYADLEKQREKLAEFEKFKANFEAEKAKAAEEAAAKAREEAEAEARRKFEETDAKTLLAEAEKTWQQRWDEAERQREQERAVFAREQEFHRLKEYATAKVNEALQANEVAPELADFVTGNNEAEIDASLEFVKQKTQQIVSGIQQAQVAARAAMPGVSTAGFAATGPMDTEPGHKTFTVEELNGMTMAEYAKHRSALLGAQASTQQNRGLYG